MGVCTSSNSSRRKTSTNLNNNWDFEWFKEKVREENKEGIFEVEAKLWEITELNKVVSKVLLSKYLFFRYDGSFLSRIRKANEDENYLEGKIKKNNDIEFTYKIASQTLKIDKQFSGKIFFADGEMKCEGTVSQMGDKLGEEPKLLENTKFEFEFTEDKYVLQCRDNVSYVYLSEQSHTLCGISIDKEGVAVWTGINKSSTANSTSLMQQYIGSGYNSDNKEQGTYYYKATYDGINNTYEGEVTNINFTEDFKFKLSKE